MPNIESESIKSLFSESEDVYTKLGKMALLPTVLTALNKEILREGTIEQKEFDLAKLFFEECRYDKIDDYINTGKFQKVGGVWHIEYKSNFTLDNLNGNCVELASKLGTLLQLAFPQRMFMLIEDKNNIANWNHFAVMDFTVILENFGLKFDLSDCTNSESIYDKKIELFNKSKSVSVPSKDLLIFDPSYMEASTYDDYLDRKSFKIDKAYPFETLAGFAKISKFDENDNGLSLPFYKKKIDGINGFGVSLMFKNRWEYPKFGVLNDTVMEFIDIGEPAFESRLLQKAGLDHNDIQYLIESVHKLDITID